MAVCALALSLGMIGTTQSFAKAHDQGVADGDRFGESRTPGQPTSAGLGPGGVSGGQKDGVRGGKASAAGGDNAVDKQVGGQGGASGDTPGGGGAAND